MGRFVCHDLTLKPYTAWHHNVDFIIFFIFQSPLHLVGTQQPISDFKVNYQRHWNILLTVKENFLPNGKNVFCED